jgi:GEVED domain/FG-GAP-like repeat
MNSGLWRNEAWRRFGMRHAHGSLRKTGTDRRLSQGQICLGLEALEARMVLASDFGDAPLPYATLLAENGARHEAIGPTLGSFRDSEADGLHSPSADADDTAGLPDDEDGVSFGSIRVGQLGAAVTVHVANAPGGARLDAWIDFNGDGSWGGPQEQIASSLAVVNGDNAITFDVPSSAADDTSFARFRLSTAGSLGVRGAASDGEVEDYAVAITPPAVASGVFGVQNIISNAPSIADSPLSVAATDLDHDGDTDVLSASFSDDKIVWFENDGSESFTLRTISTTIDGANSVSAADMDGDGDLDVLSSGPNTIAWFENDGNQNFAARSISTTIASQQSVFATDVDGDGDTDFFSAGSNFSWYENDGSQVFTAHSIGLVTGAASIVAADVDGDGDTDALATLFSLDRVIFYENNGSQVFTSRTITNAADGARSVVAADMDGDGDLDVLSASSVDDRIAWYENFPNRPEIDVLGNDTSISDGDMTPSQADFTDFGASFTTTGTLSRTFEIVNQGGLNLNLTGSPAVVVSGVNAGDFTVTVQPSSPVAPAGGTTTFTVVFDPSASGTRSATVTIANNDMDEGSFAFAIAGLGVDLPADFGDAPSPHPTTLAENGAAHAATGPKLGLHRDSESNGVHSPLADGDDTAGVPNDEDGVTFPTSISAGQLGAQITVHVADAPLGAKLDAWVDFNGDRNWGGPQEHIASSVAVINGDNIVSFDVPSGSQNGSTYARFRLSTEGNLAMRGAAIDGEIEDYTLRLFPPAASTGVFSARKTISRATDGAQEVYAADIDGDGDVDVLSAGFYDDTIAWHENDGAENFTSHTVTSSAQGNWVSAADVDGDGDMDVLSASQSDDKIAWYENDGTPTIGTWASNIISLDGDFPTYVNAADVDNDGDLDVLSATCYDDTIAWHENNGEQNFSRHIISSVEGCAVWALPTDVDGDGDLDILSAAYGGDEIAWHENNGSQDFTRHLISTPRLLAERALAADLDGDGDIDIISSSQGDDTIAWHENDGAENFTLHRITTTADGVTSLYLADMDGDGDLDLVCTLYIGNKILWYRNDGNANFSMHAIDNSINGADSAYPADVDRDGDLDIVAASIFDDTVAWYENLPDGDFDNDGDHDCADVNALTAAVANGGSIPLFDLNGDDVLSLADVDQWRVEAGNANLGAGRDYRVGDANLDGIVDGSDFSLWNAAKFTNNPQWCDGNFNADSVVDGTDFGLWNSNKFTSSDTVIRSTTIPSLSVPTPPQQPPSPMTLACHWVHEVDKRESLSAVTPLKSDPTPWPTRTGATGMPVDAFMGRPRSPLRHGLPLRHDAAARELADGDAAAVDMVMAHWRS